MMESPGDSKDGAIISTSPEHQPLLEKRAVNTLGQLDKVEDLDEALKEAMQTEVVINPPNPEFLP